VNLIRLICEENPDGYNLKQIKKVPARQFSFAERSSAELNPHNAKLPSLLKGSTSKAKETAA
jgi:hypothetical protein